MMRLSLPSRRTIARLALLLACGVARAEERVVGADNVARLEAAASAGAEVGDGNDTNSRAATPPLAKTPHSRRARRLHPTLQRRDEEAARNRADLKRRYFEFHGKELTEEMLENAIAEARERGPKRFEEGYEMRLTRALPGLEEHVQEHAVHPRTGRKLQVIGNGAGIIVSALSPGFRWNYGRNEFYCAGFDEIAPKFLPKVGTKLTMLDCYNTPIEQINVDYTVDGELLFDFIDGVYWDWCASTKNVRKGRLTCDKCDITDPLQQWNILSDTASDGTWRPRDDDFRCVTGKPPKSGKNGGGRLKLTSCTTKKKSRQAQTFVYCRDSSNCDIDDASGYIDCIIQDQCS